MLLVEISNFKSEHNSTFSAAVAEFAKKFGLDRFFGTNAIVLTRGGHVWRAWWKDAGYETFLQLIPELNSPHLPKILSRVRTEPAKFKGLPRGMTLKYVKIEKLEPMEPSNLSDAIDSVGAALYSSRQKIASIDELLKVSLKIPSDSDAEIDDIKDEIKNHREFFELVLLLSKSHAINDLSSDNVMMRGSTPVITDPFSHND